MLVDILFVEDPPTYKIRTKYVAPFYGTLADGGSIPPTSTIVRYKINYFISIEIV